MPFGIGNFLGRNAGIIGSVVGGAAGSVLPGIGTSAGAALGGALGGALQTGTNNPKPRVGPLQNYNPLQGTDLSSLISAQINRNLGRESYNAARAQGIGFSRGNFEASNAIRGAGRNAFGSLLQEAQERGQLQRADFMSADMDRRFLSQQQALSAYVGQQIAGNQFAIGAREGAIDRRFQSQLAANDRGDSYFNSLLSAVGGYAVERGIPGLGGSTGNSGGNGGSSRTRTQPIRVYAGTQANRGGLNYRESKDLTNYLSQPLQFGN